jgi:REP-associated tyrosine transposase
MRGGCVPGRAEAPTVRPLLYAADMAIQLSFPPRGVGGARPGAGRPCGNRVTHHGRAPVDARHPLHVVLRILPGIWSLRSKTLFRQIRYAFMKLTEREGFRLVHFSVQGNHIHLIVEADNTEALSRAMQSMNTRIAKRINARMSRRGRVFDDRFFARSLRNPTEVANAIAYVLENSHRHDARSGLAAYTTEEPDAFTSLALANSEPSLVTAPKTWLLRVGWTRARPRAA